jgi:hypothetical protein
MFYDPFEYDTSAHWGRWRSISDGIDEFYAFFSFTILKKRETNPDQNLYAQLEKIELINQFERDFELQRVILSKEDALFYVFET